ncbi:hypothetical protein CPT76_31955 [Paenibacillus sp. AR247]|nr:hypothetical protein CPT76_31955 [Paenibacillus sp. AR247]
MVLYHVRPAGPNSRLESHKKRSCSPKGRSSLSQTIQLHTFTESRPLAAKILLPNMEWSSIAEAFILFSQVLNR